MDDKCYRLDEMESLLDLAPGDPRQRHLVSCPLCRARLAEYRAFMTKGAPTAGSRPEEAERELEAFVSGMIHGHDGAESVGGFWSRFRILRVPRFAFVSVLAAAAVATIALVSIFQPFSGSDRRQAPLRGLGDSTEAGVKLVTAPAAVHGGSVAFTWYSLHDADRYEVQIFDADLDLIARFDAGGDASLNVEAERIPDATAPLWWRVAAFRGGDEFAHSSLSTLSLAGR